MGRRDGTEGRAHILSLSEYSRLNRPAFRNLRWGDDLAVGYRLQGDPLRVPPRAGFMSGGRPASWSLSVSSLPPGAREDPSADT